MFPAIWHRYIFLFGIISLAAGMLFGAFPTSIPQLILCANWLLEKDFSRKWQQLKSNKFFWILLSLYALHLIGMLYTQNIPRGFEDLKNKMPLFALPLVFFSTKPLTNNELNLLFKFFFLSVLVSSICCFFVYLGYTKKVIVDVRKASVFMSHIRFSLFIAFAIIGLVYSFFSEKILYLKIIYLLTVVWLLFFMYKLEMATGFLCLMIVGVLLLLTLAAKKQPKLIGYCLIFFVGIVAALVTKKIIPDLKMYDKKLGNSANIMVDKTGNGRYYLQDTGFGMAENGNLITININDYELNKEWNLRSSINYNALDKKGNVLRYTLLRYMASKGLRKDSVGITKLSEKDITNIECGNTNFKYNNTSGLIARWREVIWEYTKYKRGENPSGHTLTMRFEFWKTGVLIVKENLLFGVGTGDIQDSYNSMYKKTNSKLDPIWQLRCHNQYLAIAVAFGLVGLCVFLFYLFYPSIALKQSLHYLYWPFFLIAILSFITEDTIETQAGVTFFIYFQSLFLWLASYNQRLDHFNN